MFTGWLADRMGRYWWFIIAGYSVNLLVVPFIGFASTWQVAAALIITEHLGKAIRTPARDAVLSQATAVMGHGKGFGIHEAMDQLGAVIGPLILSGLFFQKGSYTLGFAVLAIPAILSLMVLGAARLTYPNPQQFSEQSAEESDQITSHHFTWYLAGIALVAIGFADFPLLAYHFKDASLFSDKWIPLTYALAMGIDAIAGLGLGTLFDRWRRPVLVGGIIITACFAPLVFLNGQFTAIIGVIVWGVGMGMVESVLRASVAQLVSSEKRGWAYGLYNGVFGLAWFAGSATTGWLYDINIGAMVIFLIAAQLLAIPFLWRTFSFAD